jgi:uncharacterized protein (UPF0218 family)
VSDAVVDIRYNSVPSLQITDSNQRRRRPTHEEVTIMHAVVRNYSGSGAKELFDMLEERKGEVEEVIRSVSGLVAYTMVRTADGGVTVTICQDKAGTDESLEVARNWIKENASDLSTSPPAVSEGTVLVSIS